MKAVATVHLKAPGELALIGAITFETVGTVYAQGLTFFTSGVSAWSVYLGDVSMSDSSMLALMAGWQRVLAGSGASIHFFGVPVFLQDLIKVCNLDGILKWTSM